MFVDIGLDLSISIASHVSGCEGKSTQLQKQSGHSVPWWNQEIQNKVKEERRVRRKVQKRQASQEELEQATKLKKKAVRDGKQNTFRHQIHELASSSKFWKLAKWGRSKPTRLLIFLWFLTWKHKKE